MEDGVCKARALQALWGFRLRRVADAFCHDPPCFEVIATLAQNEQKMYR